MPRTALVIGAALSFGLGAADLVYLNLALVPPVLEPAAPLASKPAESKGPAGPHRDHRAGAASSPEAAPEPSPVAVRFLTGSAALSPAAREALEEVARTLEGDEGLRAAVAGHADERGSPAYNEALSRRRARRVVAYLARRGVARRRLEAVWFGENRPLAPGGEAASLARNRRVEITLLRGKP